jgi:hypothetical protein
LRVGVKNLLENVAWLRVEDLLDYVAWLRVGVKNLLEDISVISPISVE